MIVIAQQALNNIQILVAVLWLGLQNHKLDDWVDDLGSYLLAADGQRGDRKDKLDQAVELADLLFSRHSEVDLVELVHGLIEEEGLHFEVGELLLVELLLVDHSNTRAEALVLLYLPDIHELQ